MVFERKELGSYGMRIVINIRIVILIFVIFTLYWQRDLTDFIVDGGRLLSMII